MQVVGLATIVKPVWTRLPWWAKLIALVSAAFSLSAPISYAFIPMDWSATMAFAAAWFANLVFMRSAFTVTEQKIKVI
jgi:hypothetical protein